MASGVQEGIANAYVTRISGQLDPAASVLVTINVVPQPGLDSTQWNLSAEIFAFQDISGNQGGKSGDR